MNTNTPTYSSSARGVMIDADHVVAELRSHDVDLAPDIQDCMTYLEHGICRPIARRPDGTRLYDAGDVLDWLGY